MTANLLRILPLSILVTLAAACGGESTSEDAVVAQDAAAEAELEASAPDAGDEATGQDAAAAEASAEASPEAAPEAAVEADASKDCVAEFTAQIAPVIQDLLYMSESDYPFEVVSYPDAGTGEITPAHMLQLLGLPADTAVEQRTLDQFFTQYLMAGDDGAKYLQMRNVLATNLTDLTVIRVGTVKIDIYLVGRTECGEIAGLTTIAIET